MITLRNYQQNGVDNIRNSYLAGFSAPLFVLPTGGGKTVVFCHVAEKTSQRGKNVLILVHRVELLRQTSKALTKSGVKHGLINPKYTPDLFAPVQVASVQTLVRRLNRIEDPDLIIIDEAHHANAGSWKKIIEAYPNAKILGVTATPCRGDGRGLGIDAGGVFDDLVLGPQIDELIDEGHLVKPIVYAPPKRIDLSDVKIVRGDYDVTQISTIVDKPKITGDAVQHYMKLCPGAPAVAFCVSVKHAENVAEEFRLKGYRAYSVDGSMDDDVRSRILNGLGNGTVDVVTSCDLISEGTDIPAIGCAILLRPTNSTGLYLQQVGRALRTSDGKSHAIILDHVGNVLNHGLPDDEREWTLEGKKKRKRKASDDEENIRVQQCQECFIVHEPAPKCPSCGFVAPIRESIPDQVDGELTKITSEQKKIIKKQRSREVSKARTFDELMQIQKERGYKNGWANFIFKSRNKNLI
ncbi:MAG: DEAD/DEAH box helicase [Robiginitomaculum sp.]|nr:DEAD/DEAH box helicase [Robiginitomaculum sp.]